MKNNFLYWRLSNNRCSSFKCNVRYFCLVVDNWYAVLHMGFPALRMVFATLYPFTAMGMYRSGVSESCHGVWLV